MARTGPVATVAVAGGRYQAGVNGAGQRWSTGVQSTQENPMEKAAAQQAKCAANFAARINDQGPNGWAARLRATPVSFWKSQCGQNAIQKYQMAKGKVKWEQWYTAKGSNMASTMRNQAAQDRAAGMTWQQRVVSALEIAVLTGKK